MLSAGVAAMGCAAHRTAADAASASADDDEHGDDDGIVDLWPRIVGAHTLAAAVKPHASWLLC